MYNRTGINVYISNNLNSEKDPIREKPYAMAAKQLALDQSKKVCGNFLRRQPDHFGFLDGREQDFLVSQEQAVALVTTFTYLNTDGSVYLCLKSVICTNFYFSHDKEERDLMDRKGERCIER
jgi:hypothetical protein